MTDIKHLLRIKASPEKVFKAISTIYGLKKWWTEQTTGDDSLGGVLEFSFGDKTFNKMKVTNKNDNKRLDWSCIDGDEEWIGTRLCFEISSEDDSVMLSFQHMNWQSAGEFYARCNHIWGLYMQSLKDYCEKGEGSPFKE